MSDGALAFAIGNRTFPFILRKPFHNMVEVPSMLTFRAPNNGFIYRLSFIRSFLLGCILLHLLCISVVDRNRIKTNRTFGQHNHALNTVHNLNPVVLSKVMITLEFGLFRINVYFFWKDEVNLWSFAVSAVKSVCFGEILSFSLDFNR